MEKHTSWFLYSVSLFVARMEVCHFWKHDESVCAWTIRINRRLEWRFYSSVLKVSCLNSEGSSSWRRQPDRLITESGYGDVAVVVNHWCRELNQLVEPHCRYSLPYLQQHLLRSVKHHWTRSDCPDSSWSVSLKLAAVAIAVVIAVAGLGIFVVDEICVKRFAASSASPSSFESRLRRDHHYCSLIHFAEQTQSWCFFTW